MKKIRKNEEINEESLLKESKRSHSIYEKKIKIDEKMIKNQLFSPKTERIQVNSTEEKRFFEEILDNWPCFHKKDLKVFFFFYKGKLFFYDKDSRKFQEKHEKRVIFEREIRSCEEKKNFE